MNAENSPIIEKPEVVTEPQDDSLVARLAVGGADAKRNLDDFLSGLDLLPYLVPEHSNVITWPAHPTAIATIRAGLWQTSTLIAQQNDRLQFADPENHFDIHFEVQVLQPKARMALYLHYETNPYFSQEKLRAKVETESLETYYRRRNEFIDEFAVQCQVPGFRTSRLPVQIGKAEYDFTGKTADEVARWITPIIDEVACAVNATFNKMGARRRFEVAACAEIEPREDREDDLARHAPILVEPVLFEAPVGEVSTTGY